MEYIIRYEELQNKDSICLICNKLIINKYSLFLSKCKHTFHTKCIYKNNNCPCCNLLVSLLPMNEIHKIKYLYNSNKKDKLIDIFNMTIDLAIQGNCDGQCYLAILFSNGYGCKTSHSRAIKWFNIAASHDNNDSSALANYHIGSYYHTGTGNIKQDDHIAFNHYKKVVDYNEKDYPDVSRFVGEYYLFKTNFLKNNRHKEYIPTNEEMNDIKIGYKYLKYPLQNNNEVALFLMSKFYNWGIIVKKNQQIAYDLLIRSAKANYSLAQVEIAYHFEKGIFVNKNINTALEWYIKAANNNFEIAQYKLGKYYDSINDNYKAYKYFLMAAKNNYIHAFTIVGCYYMDNIIKQENYNEAIKWFKKAVEHNLVEGYTLLALCYENGFGIEQNDDLALKYYKIAAENKDENGIKGIEFYNLYSFIQNNNKKN